MLDSDTFESSKVSFGCMLHKNNTIPHTHFDAQTYVT